MQTIADLIGQAVTTEYFARRDGSVKALTAQIETSADAKRHSEYEAQVFNFLFQNKRTLGIQDILTFKNLVIDGAIVLTTGKRLAVEVKLRMNWEKACQAEWQVRNYVLKEPEAKTNPVCGGIVFFEEFSGDWGRKSTTRQLENGWNYWYEGHCTVEGMRLDLFQFIPGQPIQTIATLAASSPVVANKPD